MAETWRSFPLPWKKKLINRNDGRDVGANLEKEVVAGVGPPRDAGTLGLSGTGHLCRL